jgi:hypothetical protein
MSITNINDYLNSIGALSTSMAQPAVPKTATNTSTDSDQDSYIPSISDSSDALSCDTYNDILQKLASALSTSSASDSSGDSLDSKSSAKSAGSTATGSSTTSTDGTSGSTSDKSSSSTSETEVITLNGVTYLQTTTTENGVETVTRTVISADNKNQNNDFSSLLKNADSQMQTSDLL